MRKIILLLVVFFNLCYASQIDATLEVVKKFGNIPTILVQNIGQENNEKEFSLKVAKILLADLKVSGHFIVQETKEIVSPKMVINFDEYKQNKIDLIARLKASLQADRSLVVDLQLLDVNSGSVVLDKQYSLETSNRFPFVAHKMTIDINNYIGAPKIDWMERLVVVSYYANPGESEILIGDYTLTYRQKVISGGLNIFPKWADENQKSFYYTKYLEKPTLFHYDLVNNTNTQIIDSPGMLVVSDVSKDGQKLLLTMAPLDQPDVYLYDLPTSNLRKITQYSGIDVSGNFIEDEKRVMFISDRLGYPNVFSVPLSGEQNNVEQMVYHGRNNNAASAYGNYIVYSSRETSSEFERNTFNLYLVSTKSDFIRRLSANGINQLPRFSNDGETIMYVKHESQQSALGIIRLNYNKTLLFPLRGIVIQSMDW